MDKVILKYDFTLRIVNEGKAKIDEPYNSEYKGTIINCFNAFKKELEKEFADKKLPDIKVLSYHKNKLEIEYVTELKNAAKDDEQPEYSILSFYEYPGGGRGYDSDYGWGPEEREYKSGELEDYFEDGGAPFDDPLMKTLWHQFVVPYYLDVTEITFVNTFKK